MKRYSFYVKAGVTNSYGIVGNFVHIFSALGDLTIRTNNGDSIVLPQAVGYKTPEIFKTLSIISDIDQIIQFYAGFGQINDGRTIVLETLDTAGGATIAPHNYVIDAGANELIAPKNMSRLGLTVQNEGPTSCVIGDSTGNGLYLQPGATIDINTGCKAEWYIFNFSEELIVVKTVEVLP